MPPPPITLHIPQPPNIIPHLAPSIILNGVLRGQLVEGGSERVERRLCEFREARARMDVVRGEEAREEGVALG